MAIIQGHIKIEAYFTGTYQDGTIIPNDKPDLLMNLNQDAVIGRTATEEEITAISGPGFDKRWGYDGRKLILPGGDNAPGLVSREHGQILVSYGERPADATMDCMSNGVRAKSGGAPLLDHSGTIKIIYEHLSPSTAPTTLIQKGQEPRVFKNNGEKSEFSLDDLTEPLWLAVGFGKDQEEIGQIQEGKMIIAPFLKVWYTG
jgi:hypothetical protein